MTKEYQELTNEYLKVKMPPYVSVKASIEHLFGKFYATKAMLIRSLRVESKHRTYQWGFVGRLYGQRTSTEWAETQLTVQPVDVSICTILVSKGPFTCIIHVFTRYSYLKASGNSVTVPLFVQLRWSLRRKDSEVILICESYIRRGE